MLSHDNIYWTGIVSMEELKLQPGDVMVSYLPLSHIAGHLLDIWIALFSLTTIVFADKMALRGSLLNTLQEARPSIFFGVPRVWEKIMEGMKEKGKATTGIKKKVSNACRKASIGYHLDDKDSIIYKLGQRTVYRKVSGALGFDRCHGMYSGAAPIAPETTKYFLSLDMVVYEAYGLAESTGAIAAQFEGRINLGSVGHLYPECQIKLVNEDADGNGEICTKGRNTMMGYLNCIDKTNEAVDLDGWLHTGDMGKLDDWGYIYITGSCITHLVN